MFRYKASLNRVHDLIEVREGTEHMILRVDADPMELVRTINSLEPRMNAIEGNAEAEREIDSIAHEFCIAIFGTEQTDKIFDFYNKNGVAVLGIVGKYFYERLGRLITKAQKRANV